MSLSQITLGDLLANPSAARDFATTSRGQSLSAGLARAVRSSGVAKSLNKLNATLAAAPRLTRAIAPILTTAALDSFCRLAATTTHAMTDADRRRAVLAWLREESRDGLKWLHQKRQDRTALTHAVHQDQRVADRATLPRYRPEVESALDLAVVALVAAPRPGPSAGIPAAA